MLVTGGEGGSNLLFASALAERQPSTARLGDLYGSSAGVGGPEPAGRATFTARAEAGGVVLGGPKRAPVRSPALARA